MSFIVPSCGRSRRVRTQCLGALGESMSEFLFTVDVQGMTDENALRDGRLAGDLSPRGSNPLVFGGATFPRNFPFFILQKSWINFDSSVIPASSVPSDLPYGEAFALLTGDTELLAQGPLGTGFVSAQPRAARGSWYLEFHVNQTGPMRVGLIPIPSDRNPLTGDFILGTTNTASVSYDLKGGVFVEASAESGTWAPLANGDRLGMLISFDDPDDSPIFGGGAFRARAYFSVNGTWQNGADPEVGTGGVEFTADPTIRWCFTASMYDYYMATSTINVANYGALAPGDWININGIVLGYDISYEYRIVMGPRLGTGDTITITINGTPYVLTAAAAESATDDEFDGDDPDEAVRAASIRDVINSGSSTLGATGIVTASVDASGPYKQVVIRTNSPYTAARGVASVVFSNTSRGSAAPFGLLEGDDATDVASAIQRWVSAPAWNGGDNPFAAFVRAGRPVTPSAYRLFHIDDHAAGNGTPVTTNNSTAFTVADFAGGVSDPHVEVRTKPSDWDVTPDDVEGWLEVPADDGIPTAFSGGEGAFDLTGDADYPWLPVFGRSMEILADADYDGASVEVTLLRADTGVVETRTIAITPDSTTPINVPIASLVRVRSLGAAPTAGSILFTIGRYWMPPGIPASISGGVVSPSPLSVAAGRQPRVTVLDENLGIFTEVLSQVFGEGSNMIDLYALQKHPGPAYERRILAFRGFATVTFVD